MREYTRLTAPRKFIIRNRSWQHICRTAKRPDAGDRVLLIHHVSLYSLMKPQWPNYTC